MATTIRSVTGAGSDGLPVATVQCIQDGRLADSKSTTEGVRTVPPVSGFVMFTNEPNIRDSEFCAVDVFAFRLKPGMLWAAGHPAFVGGIPHIVGVCSDKKVLRINAGRIVALVASHHPCWDVAVEQLVTKPVSKDVGRSVPEARPVFSAPVPTPSRAIDGVKPPESADSCGIHGCHCNTANWGRK
jgi:hypothetical protein